MVKTKFFLFFLYLMNIKLIYTSKISSKLKDLFKTKKNQLKRKLFDISDMAGGYMPVDQRMTHSMNAALIPQIEDPRITLHTFNAPNTPILPSSLPKPKIKLNIQLPKPFAKSPPIIIKEERSIPFIDIVKKDVEKAFIDALSKDRNMQYINSKVAPKLRVTLLTSTTERSLVQTKIENKIDKILDKIKNLDSQYNLFQQGIDEKLDYLDFLQKKWKDIKLNIIV